MSSRKSHKNLNCELSMHQERDPNAVSRLLTQIQALQDKVNFF